MERAGRLRLFASCVGHAALLSRFGSSATTVAGDKTAAIVGPETRLRPLKQVGSGA